MENADSKRLAMKISVVSLMGNIILSAFKFIAGIIGKSGAMISDAVHSASDVFSTIIVMIGVTLSNRKSDNGHQYGHERLECVAAMLLAVILAVTGVGIGYSGIQKIFFEDSESLAAPTGIALAAAIISIVVKEAMYWYTIIGAKKINSSSLKADAWHHRSDALSSIGSFAGILGAMCGIKILDPIASIIICLMILKAGFDILKESLDKMVDKSCDEETSARMATLVREQEGVMALDMIKTRLFGDKIYVDIEISADENLTLKDSHKIAENVHNHIENEFPMVKHCMVHVNPYSKQAPVKIQNNTKV